MLDFSELVDKVCGVMEVDREGLYINFSLVWTERSRKRSRVHINDDNTVRFLYLCADKWSELYPENVERIDHVYASTSGQDIGASIYLQVWNDRHNRLVGTDDDYVGELTADPEYLLWYHQVTVKYVMDPTDSENTRGFHGFVETLRLMATLMEDVRSLSIIGQRTFDKDSFGYDSLGEIAQVAERALSVNATNVVRHDVERQVEVNDILSQEIGHVDPTQQYPPPRPPRRSRRSQRGRGGQETITPTQPHQSYRHQQSHIPFTEGSSHQSPLMSPHHSSQHSSHQSPHHSPHHSSHQSPHLSSPTQQVFYRPIMSPQHQQSHFAFTQFSSPQTSQPQFGDSFIDFSGFQQSPLDGQSIHYTSNFLSSMFEGVVGQHQADDPAGGKRESKGEDEDEDEAEDAD
ncbi:OLC1v1005612C1 [Oldenlandia corymbosa var. corymbosa]|uniref:OLC1v1005612C1 n=1 Tax=Oldenlandia corymbosa var. corymbosa TaxID=529605 RepID=A0AAV1DHP8_OLDCO|nr:OLC1v1005612C1 [Oldenlandia corymbosa var. corymbosa]